MPPSGKYIFLRDVAGRRAYKSFYSSDYGLSFRETNHGQWANPNSLDMATILDHGVIAGTRGSAFYMSSDGGVSYVRVRTRPSVALTSSSAHGGEVYLSSAGAIHSYRVQTGAWSEAWVRTYDADISVTLDGVHRYLSQANAIAVSDDSGATYTDKQLPIQKGVSVSKDGSIALIRNPQNVLLARYDSSGEFVPTGITTAGAFSAANNKTIVTADSVIRDGVSVSHGSALSTVVCSANADIIIGQSYGSKDGVKLRRLVGGEYVEETIPGTAGANWVIAIGG